MAAGLTSYDAVAYPGYPLRQTHPGRLAAIAAVHGLDPAPPSRCRVLELGAGDGANIIPMAYALSNSAFLGIDLASTPVERGRQWIAELGLTNIDLRCGDVMGLPADLGSFDYIIAHGLYSWVPAPVRDRVLAVCRDHLAPHGVAYISYNTYPGCHMRQMVRGMMRYHTRAIEDPQERISQARAIVKFVADGQNAPGAFGDVLREESRRSAYVEDEALLFHDDLAEVSDPFWFHEFMDHAAAHGLRFLAEADYHMSDVQHLPDAIREKLEPLRQSDVIEFEQYLDFLKCRRFRQSLLCRAEAPVRDEPDLGRVVTMAAGCAAKSEGVPDLTPGTTIAFRAPKGNWTMSIDLPVGKAALLHLSENYPASLPFAELLAATSERLGEMTASDRESLAEVLFAAFAVGLVELTADAPRFTRKVGARPRASAVAQLQLRAGTERPTNLRHERAKIDHPLTRQLVLLMDGSRDRAALVEGLAEWSMAHSQGGPETMGSDQVRSVLAGQIESELNKVADLALIHT